MKRSANSITQRSAVLLVMSALCALPALAKTPAEIIKDSPASDWRPLDPQKHPGDGLSAGTRSSGDGARFAPQHVANIRTLAHEGYFDNLAVVRVQDNSSPNGATQRDDATKKKPLSAPPPTICPPSSPFLIKGLPDLQTQGPRWLGPGNRLGRWLPGRCQSEAGPGMAHPLLRRGRRGPQHGTRQQHRRRTLCHHRPEPAHARSQYHGGRPSPEGHGISVGSAARHGANGHV